MTNDLWVKTLLSSDATLREAIVSLNKSGGQIVLVISSDRSLIGTLTDGDIRRGMLRGEGLDSKVTSILKGESLVVSPEMHRDTALQLMKVNAFTAIPVVDESRKVVGVHFLKDLIDTKERSNQMIIMAGGQGIRLRPHTENCPKPLLPVNGKPMLEHIMLRAKEDGFHRFVFATHYLGHMIQDYFGDGSQWQVEIEYLNEETPLGTAGAISLLDNKPTQPVIVTNGDVITDISFGEILDFHTKHQKTLATMAVRLHEMEHPYGVVQIRGIDIIGFEEKPVVRNHINAGVYVLEPEALDFLVPNEHCDMPTLFSRLSDKNARTIVYPIHEPWMDVGRIEDYSLANGDS